MNTLIVLCSNLYGGGFYAANIWPNWLIKIYSNQQLKNYDCWRNKAHFDGVRDWDSVRPYLQTPTVCPAYMKYSIVIKWPMWAFQHPEKASEHMAFMTEYRRKPPLCADTTTIPPRFTASKKLGWKRHWNNSMRFITAIGSIDIVWPPSQWHWLWRCRWSACIDDRVCVLSTHNDREMVKASSDPRRRRCVKQKFYQL